AVALGHYDRYNESILEEELKPYQGLPLGGYKYRMHQLSSAMGHVQLKSYDDRCAEIRKSMNYFWDLLADISGLHAHRVDESSGSNMAGWYTPQGLYRPDEIGGLSVTRFAQAVRAEGVKGCAPGCNRPLHTHGLFRTCDVYGHGKPTRIANAIRDVRELDTGLEVSETINTMVCSIPWFKKYKPDLIEEYAQAYRKAAVNYKKLLTDDPGNPDILGKWYSF
ncbi:MAG: DegT/DnrJ/EryC1/StrS family aminotransferase, partial [Eubacteriales bacterium]|nr:DegT/DnrJ/EryC1/StrS family aminotransferase [Eubacteriales bacterium]